MDESGTRAPRVRGSFALGSVRFVRERFGPQAHELVLQALPVAARASLETELRDAAWKPLEHALAYMQAARELLAPDDGQFFREMGRSAGRAGRASGFGVMVSDPETTARMFTVLGRAIVDFGRVEVVEHGADGLRARFHGFPAVAALCERRLGAYEELLHAPGTVVTVEETACTSAGSPYCELQVRWRPAPGPS